MKANTRGMVKLEPFSIDIKRDEFINVYGLSRLILRKRNFILERYGIDVAPGIKILKSNGQPMSNINIPRSGQTNVYVLIRGKQRANGFEVNKSLVNKIPKNSILKKVTFFVEDTNSQSSINSHHIYMYLTTPVKGHSLDSQIASKIKSLTTFNLPMGKKINFGKVHAFTTHVFKPGKGLSRMDELSKEEYSKNGYIYITGNENAQFSLRGVDIHVYCLVRKTSKSKHGFSHILRPTSKPLIVYNIASNIIMNWETRLPHLNRNKAGLLASLINETPPMRSKRGKLIFPGGAESRKTLRRAHELAGGHKNNELLAMWQNLGLLNNSHPRKRPRTT